MTEDWNDGNPEYYPLQLWLTTRLASGMRQNSADQQGDSCPFNPDP